MNQGGYSCPEASDCWPLHRSPFPRPSGSRPGFLRTSADPGGEAVCGPRLRNRVRGRHVTHRDKYIDGLSAEIPRSALPAIQSLVDTAAITKDLDIPLPAPLDNDARRTGLVASDFSSDLTYDTATAMDDAAIVQTASVSPDAYLLNNVLANVTALHAQGYTGSGDDRRDDRLGIRPGFPHISLDGSVIGCEDLVKDALGCANSGNDGHGTFVAA